MLVRLVEQRRDARFDLIALALEREDVRRRETEAARSIRHRPFADGRRDRVGQDSQLLLELHDREVATRTDGERRRPPSRAAFPRRDDARRSRSRRRAISSRSTSADRAIAGDRIRDHVGRPDAVPLEERMQLRQRIEVLEPLVRARGRVPLVVAFGVDADEQVACGAGAASRLIDPGPSRPASRATGRCPRRTSGPTSTPFTLTTNSIVDFTWK